VLIFLILMGAFLVGFAGKMYSDARRTFGARLLGTRRERQLLATGQPGRAVVTSYRQREMLDANPKFDLVLRIELAGRPAYVVKRTERVPSPRVVTTGAELPVFVDPRRADRFMVDWETAQRM
jgi:hypothetical protein